MGLRFKVYAFLGVLALLGGVAFVYKTKPKWFTSVVQAKPSGPQNNKNQEKEPTPVEVAVAKRC